MVIVGAGFGGIGTAIQLLRTGFTDVTILEKAGDIGGVWRENTYPGAGCDIPSPLYSYSFAPNPKWPRRYSRQQDILDYLRDTAAGYRLGERLRLNTEVVAAEFDEATAHWLIHTGHGETIEADVLIPAVGQLSRPAVPDIPGADTFTGPIWHSARWRHDVSLAGRRVAVIGTGASAIQFVPRIQPQVDALTVFQRSAPYVIPKPDRAYRPWHLRMFRELPASRLFGRFGIWLLGELMTAALTSMRPLAMLLGLIFAVQLRLQVRDPRLRAAVRPDYPIGCKRLLFSNEWFPAISEPNVTLVTEQISAITATGVRTADGREHPVDVIIYGTGFHGTEFLAPMRITGRGGRRLTDVWSDGAHAYLGITVPEFPNMFLIYGPNTNLGGNSIIYMMESQARYIVTALSRLAQVPGSTIEVRATAAERFDIEMRGRLARSVWSACQSWYREPGGRISTNWPGQVLEYHRRTRTVDFTDYRVTAGRP
ncbi:MAG TPA: NAD(P)/FAD-dependent oxidoreductase [Pseudonocardiaceae bacterium]|nr:NAD(P)/FAD-dependent oxidoreductase [Pseudonocardiaceae bacterium]